MTLVAQHTAPENIMALLDHELSAHEARPIQAHIEECAECAAVADQFRETSNALATWTVPPSPQTLATAMKEKLDRIAKRPASRVPLRIHLVPGQGHRWAIAGGCAVTVVFLFAMFYSQPMDKRAPQRMTSSAPPAALNELALRDPHPTAMTVAPSQAGIVAMDAKRNVDSAQRLATGRNAASLDNSSGATPSPSATPMIAHTVSMTILVKDITKARPALDAILSR